MTRFSCVLSVALLVFPALAFGLDKVKTGGKTESGTIVEMSATEITLENGNNRKKYPVNEIDAISYDAEPTDLNHARNQYAKHSYDDALKSLAKIDVSTVTRAQIAQEIQFYKGMCAAKLALYGARNPKELETAGRQLVDFIKNANNFHYFEACETLGDLAAAMNSKATESFYNKLATAPWPEYRLRAAVLIGRAFTGRKEYDKAIAKFDEVINQPGNDGQRQAATLGKATALTGKGKVEDAIKLLNEVIEKADPDSKELHARAYNARGNCYLAAAKRPPAEVGNRSAAENTKHALTDFLHVELLYPSFPEQHAEALANLAVLWKNSNKARRSEEAQSELMREYPGSPWIKWMKDNFKSG